VNWAKWVLLAFFAIGVAMAATEAAKAHRWGTRKARNEAITAAAVLAGFGALVVIA
jgi:surface polysaccharide O-acyltransferase-like enzyme